MRIKKEHLKNLIVNIIAGTVIPSVFIYIYLNLPYYKFFLTAEASNFLLSSWIPAILAIVVFQLWRFVLEIDKDTKAVILYRFFGRLYEKLVLKKKQKVMFGKDERTAILSYIVKFFFFPIMLNAALYNGSALWVSMKAVIEDKSLFNFKFFYETSRYLIFFVDTLIFAFAYAVESELFGSKIKSVEPTFFGWAIALITYPPFNDFTSKLLPVPQGGTSMLNEGVWYLLPFGQEFIRQNVLVIQWITIIARVLILILFSIYVWATLVLGAKASNLTNRGIVAKGPYKFVRHPAYISKNLAWWIEGIIAATNPIYFISMIGWNLIYVLRAVTEEKHLSVDPEYVKYAKKVKWRFIPGLV